MPFLFFLTLACSGPCDLTAETLDLVGPNAEDCGSTDPIPCIEQAVLDGRPAWGSTSTQGIDSIITTTYSWTGSRFWLLTDDSYSPGIDGRECVGPSFPGGELDCDQTLPAGNHYQVCGGSGQGSPQPLPFNP